MTDLPDVNVWVAISVPSHPHHSRALRYWNEEAQARVAFCSITLVGFLRVLTVPHVAGNMPMSLDEAWATYQAWQSDPSVDFVGDPTDASKQLGRLIGQRAVRPRTWTDAYLAALAITDDYRLVTFDGDMQQFSGLSKLLLGP